MQKKKQKTVRQQRLEAVHTHTHTHTHTHGKLVEGKKRVVVGISIVVVMIVMAVGVELIDTKKEIKEENNVLFSSNKVVEEIVKPKALDVSTWDTTKVTIYTDPVSKKVAPIPKGYVVSQVTGETGIDTGLVIYEGTEPVTGTEIGVPGTAAWSASCNRNQWVWVPVDDVSRIYDTNTRMSKLWNITQTDRSSITNSNREPGILTNYDNERYFSQYNLPGMTRKKLLYEIDTELVETVKSIEKYGGFYIGRYETGDVTKSGSTNLIRPVVKRMNTSIHTVTWYDAYMNLRTLGANENVKANMIYGCLWDETLQWFRESGAKTDAEIYNSATWGNHKDSEGFTYYTNVGGSTGSKTKSSSTRTPTGATERNKANNIYDMAGNVWEWTMEGNGANGRCYRGGYYVDGASYCSVGYRFNYNPYYSNSSVRCACVLLYQIEILQWAKSYLISI